MCKLTDAESNRVFMDVEECFTKIHDRRGKVQDNLDRAVELIRKQKDLKASNDMIVASCKRVRYYYYVHPELIHELFVDMTYQYRRNNNLSQKRNALFGGFNELSGREAQALLAEIILARDTVEKGHLKNGTIRAHMPRFIKWPKSRFVRIVNEFLERLLIDVNEQTALLHVGSDPSQQVAPT